MKNNNIFPFKILKLVPYFSITSPCIVSFGISVIGSAYLNKRIGHEMRRLPRNMSKPWFLMKVFALQTFQLRKQNQRKLYSIKSVISRKTKTKLSEENVRHNCSHKKEIAFINKSQQTSYSVLESVARVAHQRRKTPLKQDISL